MILCVTSLGQAHLGGSSGLGRAHSCICGLFGWSGMASVRVALLCFTLPLVFQQTILGLFTKVFKRVNGSAQGLLGPKLRTNITLPHFIGQIKLQRKPRLKGWRKRLYLLMMGDAAARSRGGKWNFIKESDKEGWALKN